MVFDSPWSAPEDWDENVRDYEKEWDDWDENIHEEWDDWDENIRGEAEGE